MQIHEQKKEKKLKHIIGIVRGYDHNRLLAYLESKGVTLDQWKKCFNLNTRSEFLKDAPANLIAWETAFENITPVVGFEALTKALTGNIVSVDEVKMTVHAFGIGSTTPASGDTSLETEVERKSLSSLSYNGEKAYYTAFYDLADAIGTFSEMGLFMNGDPGTPDDGTLWDRSLASITKTGSQTLTIDYEDTLVNNI